MEADQKEETQKTASPALLSVGALFKNAWESYKAHASVFLEIMLIPALVAFGGSVIIALGRSFVLPGEIVYEIGSIFIALSPVPLIHAIHHKTDVDASYRGLFGQFWSVIWIGFLAFYVTLGGIVMLIIPGLILGVGISFALYGLVVEGRRGVDALRASRAYVKDYWWAVFGRMILLTVAYVICAAIIEAPFRAFFGTSAVDTISLILAIFFTPFSVAYIYTMFMDLRARKPSLADVKSREGRKFIIASAVVGVTIGNILLVYLFYLYIALLGG